ncbi:MAG: DHH family phosphoesterase [Archaeoglobaceae archaeon]|nr:DHH family phosphoesterase [Archaeoglobaceae archaeon]MCX8151688.1 DHH family phosphoesterase [Archaeoglobaceae archaeon]MDW8013034.1 DHH family phosphoesterase [Archaeoglobaceae archaeon]
MTCETCNGKGFIEVDKLCEVCSGTGKSKSFDVKVTEELSKEQIEMFLKGICGICKGKGKITKIEVCKICNGTGKVKKCKICGSKVFGDYELCQVCRKKPHVFKLRNACGLEDIRLNRVYVGTVSAVTDIGTFVQLNKRLRGLMKKSNFKEGDTVLVKVVGISPSGEIDLQHVEMENYELVEVSKEVESVSFEDLERKVGKIVEIKGLVTRIKQTAGPVILTLLDGRKTLNVSSFELQDLALGDVVSLIGIVKKKDKIEALEINRIYGEEAYEIRKKVREEVEKVSKPEFKGFLIKSEVLERMKEDMILVAKELKKAIYESRPIIIRHHWDSDGTCGGVALEKALMDLVEKVHGDNEEKYYLVKRRVSRAPFYELEDVLRDLDESLEDVEKFGDKIPVVVLVDNGSGREDIPAIRQFLTFGADVVVIDHHYPDSEVDKYLLYHINPYKVGGDSNYTAGVMCVEIARMVSDLDLKHLAAVSVVGDRASGEVEKYVEISGLSREELQDIVLAVEFESFHLRFRSASTIIHELLGFGKKDRQKKLIEILSSCAKQAIEEQVSIVVESLKVQVLPNGVTLAVIDVENYAKKFTFPPPGKLTGEVHDRLKKRYQKIVTIGYGPDFAIIRSDGVEINVPKLVYELKNEVIAGVDGGGHLNVGSIKFVQAKRKDVLAKLAAKIGGLKT